MPKEIAVINAPSNLGLKEPAPGKEPGVKKLPDWLRKHGFYRQLRPSAEVTVLPPPYSMVLDEPTGVRNAPALAGYSAQLAAAVEQALAPEKFSVVVGGDCSILMGCMLGLKRAGRYGLFFIDGHTDFILPAMSKTGGAAGMDLAMVTGHGPNLLTDIQGLSPYVEERLVTAFGNRYLHPSYVAPILTSAIDYHDLPSIRRQGPGPIVEKFLEHMRNEKADGFWIHLDVDVLNNDIMPCVDSPQPDGLLYDELVNTLRPLLQSPLASGINITILNPDLDEHGIFTEEFVKRTDLRSMLND